MEGGLIDTPMTWDNYASVIDEVLTMNEKTLAAARKKMVRTVWEQEPSFKDSQLDIALYLRNQDQPRPGSCSAADAELRPLHVQRHA